MAGAVGTGKLHPGPHPQTPLLTLPGLQVSEGSGCPCAQPGLCPIIFSICSAEESQEAVKWPLQGQGSMQTPPAH